MQVSVAGSNQGACEMYLYSWVNFSKCGSTPGVATITVTASVKGAAATSWNCNTVGTSNLWLQYANTLAQPKDVGTVVCTNSLTGASTLTASFTAPTTVETYVKSADVFSIGLGQGGQAINIDTYKSNTESATLEVKTWDATARQMTGTAEATWKDTGASWGFGTVKITFDVIFPTI